jgi:hypothetical protein
MADIFAFWEDYEVGERIHSLDKPVFAHLRTQHGFDLDCLPVPFYGCLKTAPIVLLYLNPGLSKLDLEQAKSNEGQKRRYESLKGLTPLSELRINSEKSWWVDKAAFLEIPTEKLLDKVAVLQLCAYHSKEFRDWPLIAALPSSRVAISWAQETLFADARAGKRAVICLRSASYWGLAKGGSYDGALFAPLTTRSGHIQKSGGMRDFIRSTVHKILDERRANH